MNEAEMIYHAQSAVKDAENFISRLHPDGSPVIEVGGFIGLQGRHLFNNLGSGSLLRYLEVGVLHGASACCVGYNNPNTTVVGIDNFSQFDGCFEVASANMLKYCRDHRLVVADCWGELPDLGDKFDIFSYDGDHSKEATARAIGHFLPLLADPFIMVIDDYSWDAVRSGHVAGIYESGVVERWGKELFNFESDAAGWWNGMLVGVYSHGK